MKYVQKWLQKLRLIYWQLRCFTSIEDLPARTWFKIHETGDLRPLYKGYLKFGVNTGKVWEMLFNEFIKNGHLSKEYLKHVDMMAHIGDLTCKAVINPTPIGKATLLMKRAEMEEKIAKQGTGPVSFMDIFSSVNKTLPYHLDPKTTSTDEFYSYLKK
jgi:hypothetical protein